MKPQLRIPNNGDPYYNTKSIGGYNPCIAGNPTRRLQGLNVLPNCVGWAVGRFNAIGEYGKCRYLGSTNACYFINLAKSQRLEISLDPTLGGVMVWKGGKTGEGHVAVVEAVLGGNKVITSESEYYGRPFCNFTRVRSDGNWRQGCYWMGASYKYLGCIVHPDVEDDEVITDRKLYNKDTNQIVTVKGILKDSQNYIRLADLAGMGVLDVSYNTKENLAEVGRKRIE